MEPKQRKYILENVNKKSIEEISRDLNLKERKIRKFLKKRKEKEKQPDSSFINGVRFGLERIFNMSRKMLPSLKVGIFAKLEYFYLFFLCLLPCVAVLAYLSHTILNTALSLILIIIVNLLYIYLFQLHVATRIGAVFLKSLETLFTMLVLKMQGPMDIILVFKNLDLAPDLINAHTTTEKVLFFGSIILICMLNYILFRAIKTRLTHRYLLIFPIAMVLLQIPNVNYVFASKILTEDYILRADIASSPLISKKMKIKFNEDSDVIYLHLESLNSKVANGDVLINGKHYDQPAAPVFLKFAEKGLYFPEFYNTTITTIQNQESILCGVSDNLDGPQAKQKEDFPFKCLPEIFKENGYTTYFFKAHRLGFANTGNYMKKIGFDFVINREIMKEGDKETKWGFNDDIFYQRIFEFLSREKAEKKFVYIAVSSLMHWPFKTKEEYKHLRVYPDPKNPYQTIANATRQQDEMLHSFIKSFEQYDKSDTHLFVFGDHSVPVGINNTLNVWGGLYDDIYLTSMFYIPPNPLQHRIIKERYNHISLFHTILELLSENYMSDLSISDITPNSLNKKDRFIRLNQPLHDRQIAIVRYPHKWTYHFYRREVVYFNLSKDRFEQNPIVLAKNFEKAQFIKFVESDERKRKKMEKE